MTFTDLAAARAALDAQDDFRRRLDTRSRRCHRAAMRRARIGRPHCAADWWRALVRSEVVRVQLRRRLFEQLARHAGEVRP